MMNIQHHTALVAASMEICVAKFPSRNDDYDVGLC